MGTAIRRNNIFVPFLVSIFLFAACDSNGVFDQYTSLSGNVWNLDEPVEFEFQINDTITRNNLFINIRNNNDYGFSNLFLITHLKFPDGKKVVDTLEYEMTDQSGRFLGDGLSEKKDNKLFYKEGNIFPNSGNYKLSIQQAMRRNGSVEGLQELKGITDVGFRIEKIN
jgi:gliding motility-associated lipoprotein GldH